MAEGPDIARIASLIGDPARSNMLLALLGGKALTATELAGAAGVTLQTRVRICPNSKRAGCSPSASRGGIAISRWRTVMSGQ